MSNVAHAETSLETLVEHSDSTTFHFRHEPDEDEDDWDEDDEDDEEDEEFEEDDDDYDDEDDDDDDDRIQASPPSSRRGERIVG